MHPVTVFEKQSSLSGTSAACGYLAGFADVCAWPALLSAPGPGWIWAPGPGARGVGGWMLESPQSGLEEAVAMAVGLPHKGTLSGRTSRGEAPIQSAPLGQGPWDHMLGLVPGPPVLPQALVQQFPSQACL